MDSVEIWAFLAGDLLETVPYASLQTVHFPSDGEKQRKGLLRVVNTLAFWISKPKFREMSVYKDCGSNTLTTCDCFTL